MRYFYRNFAYRTLSRRGTPAIAAAALLALVLAASPTFAFAETRTYVVREGDTISGIAIDLDLDEGDLLRLNQLGPAELIFPGQKLRLPEATGPAPAAGYTVQAGDTLSEIAFRHGLSTAALRDANNLDSADLIVEGQRLTIPPGGTPPAPPRTYVVQPGDTLTGIALWAGVTPSQVRDLNGLADENRVVIGQTLKLPAAGSAAASGEEIVVVMAGETLSDVALRAGIHPDILASHNDILDPDWVRAGQRLRIPQTAEFMMPVDGPVTVRFGGSTPFDPFHAGVDIGVWTGTPVRAMRAGTVVVAGWAFPGEPLRSKGLMVVLEHDRGYTTLYGHLNELNVKPGDWVTAGQVIAWSGNTGLSTGPHLHLELRRYGQQLDPLKYAR
jgi:murein DD-endopeptidase MepM/ murein hydrolase activator NlpD